MLDLDLGLGKISQSSDINTDVDIYSIPEERLMDFGEFTAVSECRIKTAEFERKTILEKCVMVDDTIKEEPIINQEVKRTLSGASASTNVLSSTGLRKKILFVCCAGVGIILF